MILPNFLHFKLHIFKKNNNFKSEQVGAKTLVALDGQGEQLTNASATLKDINENMKEAEKNITGMEKCCGLCVCPWNRSRTVKEKSKMWKEPKMNSTATSTLTRQKNILFL